MLAPFSVCVCSLRFKTPSDIFTLSDLAPAMTVEVMKVLLESRCGIGVKQQKLFYGAPRRELFGRDRESVFKVLEITAGAAPVTITVEVKGETPRAPGASSSSAAKPKNSSEWGELWEDEASFFDTAGSAHVDEDVNDEENFIAYLAHDPNGSTTVAAAPSPTSTTVGNHDDDIDPFADGADGGDDGGWGDEDGGDEFMNDDDDGADEMTVKKQAKEKTSEAAFNMMQSSKNNAKLGEYEILTLPTLLQMMKKSLSELDETIGCSVEEAAILMRCYRWKKDALFAAYLENPTAVQEKCGVSRMKHRLAAQDSATSSTSPAATTVAAPSASKSYGECSLCGEEMNGANSLDLGCTTDGSHRFCNG